MLVSFKILSFKNVVSSLAWNNQLSPLDFKSITAKIRSNFSPDPLFLDFKSLVSNNQF